MRKSWAIGEASIKKSTPGECYLMRHNSPITSGTQCESLLNCAVIVVGPPTVVRIHRLLRQTNDMLERLQTDFDKSLRHDLATVQTDLATVQSDLQLSDSKSDTTESDDQVRFFKILQVVKKFKAFRAYTALLYDSHSLHHREHS